MEKERDQKNLKQIFDQMGAAIMVIGQETGEMLSVNERVCRDMELKKEQIINRHYSEIFRPEFAIIFTEWAERCADGQEHSMVYNWSERLIWEQITGQRISWYDTIPALLITITNITEVTRSDYEYERLAYFDNFMDLPNGKKLEVDVNQMVSYGSVSLLHLKIERFDEINHLFGFDAGDQLLISIRDWLLASKGKRAQLYYVNDGFILLGIDLSLENAELRAEQIMKRFNEPWHIIAGDSSHPVFCSVKMGIISGDYLKNEMRNLLLRTTKASKSTKGYAVYNEETDKSAKADLLLRQTFINCIQNGMIGFDVHFQPIVEAGSYRWSGVESLCRWTTPEGKAISPLEFIHMAEQLGLIDIVDNWVRETAMQSCSQWDMPDRNFFLDVNFSPTQSINDVFIDNLMATLNRIGSPDLKVNIEITESAKMQFTTTNIEGFKKLKDNGFSVSLDDFGTGYSSFENLIKLSPNNIKTEKVLIDGIENDADRQYLLTILIDMAHHLGMKIIAEGVETENQKQLLEKLGIDYMQGFLFSMPIPSHKMEQELWRFNSVN